MRGSVKSHTVVDGDPDPDQRALAHAAGFAVERAEKQAWATRITHERSPHCHAWLTGPALEAHRDAGG